MKTLTVKQKITCVSAILGLATVTAIAAPPVIIVTPPAPAPVVVPAPAPPAVTVTVGVPDSYVWDGSEYVGLVGDQYYYLGTGNAWLPMTGDRLTYFHGWEGHHHDWAKQAIHNDKYRRDAQGHDHPWGHDRDDHGHN